MKQAKIDSILEVTVNTLLRAPINMAANEFVFPLFGYQITLAQNFGFMIVFTVISLTVSYIIRRIFNGRPVWATLKSKLFTTKQKEQLKNGRYNGL